MKNTLGWRRLLKEMADTNEMNLACIHMHRTWQAAMRTCDMVHAGDVCGAFQSSHLAYMEYMKCEACIGTVDHTQAHEILHNARAYAINAMKMAREASGLTKGIGILSTPPAAAAAPVHKPNTVRVSRSVQNAAKILVSMSTAIQN